MPRATVHKLETRTDIVKASEQRSYADVCLVQRTLAVLECANRLKQITVSSISEDCGIPPSSVVRILETLCAEGYLTHISRRGGYSLTSKVKSLSAGFHSKSLIMEVLQPVVDGLTKEFLWPFALATLDTDAMVVQYSSIPLSPLAHVRSTLHKRSSLISRAHGVAYMALLQQPRKKPAGEARAGAQSRGGSYRREQLPMAQGAETNAASSATRRGCRTPTLSRIPSRSRSPCEPGAVIATIGVTYFRKVAKRSQIARMVASLKREAASAAEAIKQRM